MKRLSQSTHRRVYSMGLAALSVLCACRDEIPTAATHRQPPAGSMSMGVEGGGPGEDNFRRLAAEVPGFAGYFIDPSSGELVIRLTDISRAATARVSVARYLPAELGGRSMKIQGARFTFDELSGWRERLLEPVFQIDGVSFMDLDEAQNVLVIGVAGSQGRRDVPKLVAQLGIPAGAVRVTQTDEVISPLNPETPMPSTSPDFGQTVSSYFRPLIGGVAIGRSSSTAGSYIQCTLGFMANLSGVRVFITNTHCTEKSWDYDTSIFHQPIPESGDIFRVGREYKDKRGTSCGFLSVNVCRYSDAAAVSIDAGVSNDIGKIVRTLYAFDGSRGSGSRVVDASNPTFTITSKGGTPLQGARLNKIGVTTGWTRGDVNRTCVDTGTERSYSKLRCQYFVAAGVDNGDSGSPVFADNGDGTVSLYGILWGRATDGNSFVFSPMSGIEQDLGTMTVVYLISPPPPIYTEPPPDCSDPWTPC